VDALGGLGCNAGGQGQECRFCGRDPYPTCPGPPRAIVVLTTIIAGTVETFDQDAYKAGLRRILPRNSGDVEIILNVTAASVKVEAMLLVLVGDSSAAPTLIADTLSAMTPSQFSVGLGVEVTAVEEVGAPMLIAGDERVVLTNESGLSATGSGSGGAFAALGGSSAIVTLLFILHRRRRHLMKAASETAAAVSMKSPGPGPAPAPVPATVANSKFHLGRSRDVVNWSRIEVVRHLAKGTLGDCFKVRLDGKEPLVVLRCFSSGAIEASSAERLKEETHALSKITDPHLLTVIGFVSDYEFQHGMLIEYMPHSLSRLLERSLSSSEARARLHDLWLPLTTRIAKAVETLHKMGFGHFSLHPGNVLLDSAMTVKLADFGRCPEVVRLQVKPGQDTSIAIPSSESRHLYLAPELLRGEAFDRSADMWALGCIVARLVTLEPIYGWDPQQNLEETLTSIAEGKVDTPFSKNSDTQWTTSPAPEIPAAIKRLVATCTEADPTMRPPAQEAVQTLIDVRHTHATTLSPEIAPSHARRTGRLDRWVSHREPNGDNEGSLYRRRSSSTADRSSARKSLPESSRRKRMPAPHTLPTPRASIIGRAATAHLPSLHGGLEGVTQSASGSDDEDKDDPPTFLALHGGLERVKQSASASDDEDKDDPPTFLAMAWHDHATESSAHGSSHRRPTLQAAPVRGRASLSCLSEAEQRQTSLANAGQLEAPMQEKTKIPVTAQRGLGAWTMRSKIAAREREREVQRRGSIPIRKAKDMTHLLEQLDINEAEALSELSKPAKLSSELAEGHRVRI
jgi:serine/threonine protein kinase